MAKDMLQAVFNAEEECRLRESNAKAEASKRIQQAKADAVQLIKDAENDANAKAQAILDNEKRAGEKALEKAKLDAKNECTIISDTAEKNRTKVIKNAVKYLIG